MQTETISNSQNAENHCLRQAWSKPDLIDYWTVGDLTQGGTDSEGGEDSGYTSVIG